MSLPEAFAVQARACRALGSPFMGQLCDLMAARWPVAAPIAATLDAWPGDVGPGGASLPLRLAGGLHALVLQGKDPALAAAYPPRAVADDRLWQAVSDACRIHASFLAEWVRGAPQTNEVRRSGVLIAAGHMLAARYGLPLDLSELGASAGLNLNWDRYALAIGGTRFGPTDAALTLTPDWDGPLPPPDLPAIAGRRGVDLNPLDPADPGDALRLTAYLWPDQPDRIARTRAALALPPAPVDRDDAIDWLARRLATPSPGVTRMIFHTVAWQYFPPAAQARGRALIEAAGARASDAAPLAWFGMENDGGGDGARLTLRLWPDGRTCDLGRADFHGRWVRWREAGA